MSAAITRLVNTMSVLMLVMGIGCESPTRESNLPPPQPAPPLSSPAGYSLSGTVRDTANRFISDARVHVVEGSQVGVSTMTDTSGRFELPGTFTGVVVVRAEKAGYVSMIAAYGARALRWRTAGSLFRYGARCPECEPDRRLERDAPGGRLLCGSSRWATDAHLHCVARPFVVQTTELCGTAEWCRHQASANRDVHRRRRYLRLVLTLKIRWGYTGGSYLLEKLAPSGYLAIWGFG